MLTRLVLHNSRYLNRPLNSPSISKRLPYRQIDISQVPILQSFHAASFASDASSSTEHDDSTRPRKKQQDTWNSKLEEFKAFIQQHGHGRVPQSHDSLGNWVNHNRKQYKKRSMTPERLEVLEQAGFVWNADEAAWMDNYEEMCEYYREHGHCLVPRSHEALATWVRMNRHEYQKFIQNKTPCFMTSQRVDLLNKIDFVWDARDATWWERLNELKEFVGVNGYGVVPPKTTHAALVDWLRYQKKLYREKTKGKKVSLTDERIAELRKLGFILDS